MAFIDELITHLHLMGYGTPGKQIFGSSAVAIPEGDGPFIVIHQTGGFENLEIHNRRGAYERPTAQIAAIHKLFATANSLALSLTHAMNVRNTVLGLRNMDNPSITRVNTVATVAMSTPHFLAVDQLFTISGATQPEYNGTFAVTGVPSNSSITFTVPGSPATPATGTIVVHFPGTFYQEIRVRQPPIDLNTDSAGRARLVFNIRATKNPS
jgi:hypothetical protein